MSGRMSASIQDVGFNYLSQMMELLLEAQNDPVFSDLIFILLSGAMVIAPLILITAADFIVRRFLLKPRIIVRKEPRGAQVNNEKISSLQANVVSLASSNECNAAELIEFKENMEVFLLESEVLKRLTSDSEAENRRLEELHSRDANTIARLQNELNKSSEDLFEYSEKVVSLESAYVALKGQLDSQSSRYHVDKESLKDGYQLDHEKEGRPSSVESLKSEEIIKEFERKELILQETLASTSDMLESSVSRVADLSEHLIVLSKSLEEARALHQKEVETLTTKIRRQEDLLLRLTSVSQERNVDYKSNNVASLGKFVADTSEIGFNERAPVMVEGYVMRRFQEENIVEEEGRETEGESKNLKLYVAYLQQELDEALESKKELMAKKASLETALRNTSLSSRDMTENHSALKGKGLEATLTADEALKTELREARASLEAIVLRAQQSEKLLDEHQTTIAALEMKLQLKSAALEESKNQMAMSEEEFAQLRRELNSSYERLTALRGQMIRHTIAHKSSERESRAKLYLMTEEKDAQIAKLHGLSAELERLRTRVVEQEDRHEVALKSVEQQLDIPKEEQSIAGESSQTEACLDTELSQKSADNEEKRTMRRSHERDLLALQRSSESEIADLREQICVLKEECCTLKASIFGLKDERDVLQRQLLDAEALREQLAGAETSALSSKICSAGETSAEFANAEVDAKTDALPSLGEQLAAEVSAGKTEDKLVALQQTNAKLMAEKREKELQLTLLMKELESNRRYVKTLQDEIEIVMETNEIASAENIRKIKELLQTVDNQSQLLIQATQREDARGIVRFTDDHKISTKATPECKVEDSKRKQSVLQGVEEVERLKSEIADLKTSVKEKDLLIANLRAEAIKASKLYNALLAKKAEVEAQNLRLVKRLDVSSEQEFDSSIDYTRVMELKSAVLALEAELQAARTSEESLKTELLCISNDFARTKEDLAEVESQYSRLIEEISVAGDGETGSIPAKFPATQRIGSVKQFPVISGAEEEVRTARESRSLPISPLSTATSNSLLAKSPNKLSRQLRTLPRDSTLSKTGDSSGKESESLEAKRRSEESLTLSSFSFASVSKHGSFPITALTTLIRARAKMLLLCDMSATMGTGGRIKAQRKCVYTIMQTCIEQNCCFALGTWNSRVSWLENSSQGMVEGHGWWRRGDEVLNDFKALDAVEPEGGHDMRASLEAAIRAYPDTTDLVVICHGITWPFEPLAVSLSSHMVTNWQAFRRRYPACMARDGDGVFVVYSTPNPTR